jgi:Flp pilus assembly protein TadD
MLQPDGRMAAANRKELEAIKGPETGTISATLKAEAEKAEEAGDYKRASQIYKQIVDKEPDNKEAALALADDLRRSGDSENALKITDEVLKKDPNNASALESKGLVLMNTGEFTEASSVFGQVMKADAHRWRTLDAIGVLFALKNMDTEAFAYYNAALAESTDNVSVLNNLALTQAMNHEYDNAIITFQKAQRHAAQGSDQAKHVDLNLALVQAIAGHLDEAEQTAAPHLSKAGLYNNMGFYAYLSKNTELSRSYLNMALTQNPTYYERAWKNLGIVNGENEGEQPENAIPAASGFKQKSRKDKHKAKQVVLPAEDSAPAASATVAPVTAAPVEEAKPAQPAAGSADTTPVTAAPVEDKKPAQPASDIPGAADAVATEKKSEKKEQDQKPVATDGSAPGGDAPAPLLGTKLSEIPEPQK